MNIPNLDKHLKLPVFASPMFLVSGVELVLESCKNNIIGTFPSVNRRTTEEFDQMLTSVEEQLAAYNAANERNAAPFGVNLVVHRSNPRWMEDLKVCVKHKVPIIITSLGAVKDVVDAIHGYGGLVFHDVANAYHARKAAEAGVDGIIAVANGAGGHSGTISPFALVGEIKSFFDGTVILGGSISSGSDVAAALQMGADYAYMGTRFINVKESMAPEEYQEMVINANSSDILLTSMITGVNCNFLKDSLVQAGYDLDQFNNAAKVNYSETLKPPKEGAKTWVDTWSAGHGAGVIKDVPTVKELVDRLEVEFKAAVKTQIAKTSAFV